MKIQKLFEDDPEPDPFWVVIVIACLCVVVLAGVIRAYLT